VRDSRHFALAEAKHLLGPLIAIPHQKQPVLFAKVCTMLIYEAGEPMRRTPRFALCAVIGLPDIVLGILVLVIMITLVNGSRHSTGWGSIVVVVIVAVLV